MTTQQIYDGEGSSLPCLLFSLKSLQVIIVGGGPAGCATALALHRPDPPRSVLLIDDADPTTFKVVHSH